MTQSITVGKGSQSVSFGAAPTLVVGGTGAVTATATSGLPVTFSSTTMGICTISGSTVTVVTAGACIIAADQAGNANYNAAAQVTQSITIGKVSQSVSFGGAPTVVVGGTGTVTATATSGLAVTYTSTTRGVCTVSGSTVRGVAAGACTIAADQAGNANYNAASQVTQNITVGAASLEPISAARVFAYAEANYSGIFTGAATPGQYQQYNYRYYPASGNYLGIDTDGVIYVLGPSTGNVIAVVGPVESFRGVIVAWETTMISDARVFAYEEANFPGIFTGVGTPGQYQQYGYRYYPSSGNYLAVDNARVIFMLGPYTGNVMTVVGPVESFRDAITAWEATQ